MGRVRAVLECLEIAGRTEEEDGGGTTRARYSSKVCIHVGEVLHGQEHLCFNFRDFYPLQSPAGRRDHQSETHLERLF